MDNALSDLGHAVRSPVAPIFNFGLTLGGFLVSLTSIVCFSRIHRILSYTVASSGFTLILVAVFDEVYGCLHFAVSVAFFLSLGLTLIVYALVFRRFSPILALALAVAIWILHVEYGVPRGAAIPELTSIALTLPFYLDLVRRSGELRSRLTGRGGCS